MTTAVTKSSKALPAAIASLATIGQNAIATAGGLGTGDAFGRFTKQGVWEFGQENIEVQEGSIWLINPLSIRHGWIHWPEEGRPTEVTVPLTEPLPAAESLPEVDGDWGKTFSFQARCTNGEDEGQQVIFKGSSMGFNKCAAKLAQAIGARAVAGELEVVPLVEMGADFYTHKQYGRINTPELKVTGWAGMDGDAAEGDDDDEKAPEKPAKAKKEKAKAKPARRRRVKA